jgi:hypothetical protein
MAEGLLNQAALDDAGRVRQAYERVLGRPARAAEVDRALTFIRQVETQTNSRAAAWQSFCKALIASNEFLYVN